MSKMSELSTAVAELHKCGEALIEISQTLREIFSGDEPAKTELAAQPQQEPAQPTITLEEVRAVLAEKSVAGHRAEVQALIRECGADKLSAVDPSRYADLKAKAEVL